jgi:hypothetical protein
LLLATGVSVGITLVSLTLASQTADFRLVEYILRPVAGIGAIGMGAMTIGVMHEGGTFAQRAESVAFTTAMSIGLVAVFASLLVRRLRIFWRYYRRRACGHGC